MAAEKYLTIEDVARLLQVPKEQVTALAKKGMLRGFLDQKTYKFKPSDVESYKKKLASSATAMSSGMEATEVNPAVRKDPTSKIDLAEIDAAGGIEDADQTSVMAPADDEVQKAKTEDTPVFQFSDHDLGLQDEAPSSEDADQTSLLAATDEGAAKKEADTKPDFDFAEKELNIGPATGGDKGESVLVADDSESSVDILDVAEESSSDSSAGVGGSSLKGDADDASSGDEVEAISDIEESPQPMPAVAPDTGSTLDRTVTDVLGVAEESSEDELQELDLDKVVDTQEAIIAAEDASSGSEESIKTAADATDTVPVVDEGSTVGIDAEQATTQATVAGETAAVAGVVADAIQEATVGAEEGSEEGGEALAEEAAVAEAEPEPAAVGMFQAVTPIQPSLLYNIALAAGFLIMIGGAVFLFSEMFEYQGGFTQQVIQFVKQVPLFNT